MYTIEHSQDHLGIFDAPEHQQQKRKKKNDIFVTNFECSKDSLVKKKITSNSLCTDKSGDGKAVCVSNKQEKRRKMPF